ncbi:hypothetical protein JAAARDRAFT_179271 [Jaapia argillacea MUCL 33604]|uniref:AMP-dependent synthetase/ligase domain-containing protein n=1 Tax=Jaapia argillacea MUCL 33604 TaxID=933084 RepID=A0A067Q241_9AGAM|nr:hypothetical protein JAAARDRAFT_179271 [Jaapia argillacea MUCL 33604]
MTVDSEIWFPIPESNLVPLLFSNPFHKSSIYTTNVPTEQLRKRVLERRISPTRPIFIHPDTGAQIGWARLQNDVYRFADGFRNKLGFKPAPLRQNEPYTVSSPVLLHLPNCMAYMPLFFGAAAAGLSVTMCNPYYTPNELLHILVTSRPAIVATTPMGLPVVKDAINQLEDKTQARLYKEGGRIFIVNVAHDDYGLCTGSHPHDLSRDAEGWVTADYKWLFGRDGFQPDEWSGDENAKRVCCILWSSGTSGKSKGVVLTHKAMCAGTIMQGFADPEFGADECFIGFVPFFHVLGLSCIALLAPAMGASVVVMPRFDLDRFLQLASVHRATLIHIAPPVAVALAKTPLIGKYDLSSIRACSSGGAPLPADVIRTVYDRLGVLVKMGYGASEAGGITSQMANTWAELEPLLGTTGTPFKGVQIKIVDTEGSGRVLPIGEEGEILIKSPSLMSGYLNDPETTKETLTPDGWYRSGDIGTLDKDGNVKITDRMKDMIKSSGFQCSPVEIEGALAGHTKVADAAVGSIYSEEHGTEFPRAYVVPMDRSLLNYTQPPSKELVDLAWELSKRVESSLIKYKWLRGGIVFIDQVPKNPSGKILRRLFKNCRGVEVNIYDQHPRQAKL